MKSGSHSGVTISDCSFGWFIMYPLNPKRIAPQAEAKEEHLISLRNKAIKKQAERSSKIVATPYARGPGISKNTTIKGEKIVLNGWARCGVPAKR